jgi:hypothetical protein
MLLADRGWVSLAKLSCGRFESGTSTPIFVLRFEMPCCSPGRIKISRQATRSAVLRGIGQHRGSSVAPSCVLSAHNCSGRGYHQLSINRVRVRRSFRYQRAPCLDGSLVRLLPWLPRGSAYGNGTPLMPGDANPMATDQTIGSSNLFGRSFQETPLVWGGGPIITVRTLTLRAVPDTIEQRAPTDCKTACSNLS